MKYANYEEAGELIGFYDDEINDVIPEPNIPITDEEWQDCITFHSERRVEDGVIVSVDFIPTYEDSVLDIKLVRDAALSEIVHTYPDGASIQVRPPEFGSDESNMRNAIESMTRLGTVSRIWFMSDNTTRSVTITDLREALDSGQDQATIIWDTFFTEMASI
tara:strand:- start:24535 stop:25020 length:486 start_codon:yes stop_codon:yes gene_type:complete